ncbi:cytochrome P450 [Tsukamurella sp. 8F]|uniref:cytochrome P450 n=1 Tax=unclassified Tsukamurella TaxID=2633480 RepID=UPI0023B97312|nr:MULTISPECIES: cytochrome P450 [unclassified Tsukamurella]MDF0531677.1 cytochrome P450 [Tsukamurella sp. 8J]MDF0588923.1 cytochrome P450 [Tsukamurella sp. 8F]
MATTSTNASYLLGRTKRMITPTLSTLPGVRAIEGALLDVDWRARELAPPPAGSDLKPVIGDRGLPILGHVIELFRGGPDFLLRVYRKRGPVFFIDLPILPAVMAVGPDATQTIFTNRHEDYSQEGWYPLLGPFFNRGLTLLDFEEHRYHRRIMQAAFTPDRLAGYVAHFDRVASETVASYPSNGVRLLLQPAAKQLTLDIASLVFMGLDPRDNAAELIQINRAFTTLTRAGSALIRRPIPPFRWWRGLRARKVLEDYFYAQIGGRRKIDGTDMLSVLSRATDENGDSFTDTDIVNHMIQLMMAAHDTSTSAITTMVYHLAAHPEWQRRCRAESAAVGDGTLDIEAIDRLKSLDLVMKESLRLVTPLPFNMRRTVRDTELLGYHLPAGTNVVTWPAMNHRLPELWTDPAKFDPDRFSEPRSEHKKHRYAFAPFGGGAHNCIGQIFANLEVKTVMHRLLLRYEFSLPTEHYRARWDYGGMPIPVDGMPIALESADGERVARRH